MNILVEGLDCVGKDTQIQLIKNECEKRNKTVHIIHYSNLRFTNKNLLIKEASERLYKDMFNKLLINERDDASVFIMNRAHIGEVVYSPLYRHYSGSFVYDYENAFVALSNGKTLLMLFTDEVDKIIERDKNRNDGKTFSLDRDKKQQEKDMFEDAVNKSKIKHKIIHLNNRQPQVLFDEEVLPFIKEII